MILAIASDSGTVAPHFGRCQEYVLIELSDQQVANRRTVPNPGHEPGVLPGYLAERGVGCIIAGGMGVRARSLFAEQGIDVIVGLSCTVDEAVAKFRSGEAGESGQNFCDHGAHSTCEEK